MESSGGWLSIGFGKYMRGIFKIVLASLIITLTNTIPLPTSLAIGETVYDLSVLVAFIRFVVPFGILLSALYDLDIKL